MANDAPLKTAGTSPATAQRPALGDETRSAAGERGFDHVLDTVFGDLSVESGGASRWMGWRLRMLVVAALLGCVGLLMLARELASAPYIDAAWNANAAGAVELASSSDPALSRQVGKVLVAVSAGAATVQPIDALALQRSSRWLLDDGARQRHRVLHEQLSDVLTHDSVSLAFADGTAVELRPQQRGFVHLPVMFWVVAGFGLVLYLVAMVVALAKPTWRNALYALMGLCQAGNLVFIAVESTLALGLPPPLPALDMPLRMAFDLVTAAAMVSAVCVHPRRLPHAAAWSTAAWLSAFGIVALSVGGVLSSQWWWTQGGMIALGAVGILLLSWSHHTEGHPLAIVLRRFGVVTWATLVLLTAAVAAADGVPAAPNNVASVGSIIWYVFLASLLLLVPFMSRSQQIMREFSLLAAISTVATSLDLLFVAVFSLGQFASLTLSLFVSLGVYSGARQWILNQLLGSSMLTTERMFEQLYRIAREVEAHPERTQALLSRLLRDLFDPMEVTHVEQHTTLARLTSGGSTMLVPVPVLSGDPSTQGGSIAMRYAQRGRRLFTSEDARLTDRIVEQLRRAVAFDKAVEQGRSEERLRIAQDLHDDIGARLLTLMYKAQSSEMEEYIRHTLQDLKTLTRGLAASNHLLSHAAAEWKADLTQRLSAAHMELGWSFESDKDVMLSVVQWSALTRVLRELVSNAIAHANAQRVEVVFSLRADCLDLSVSDNGTGRNPRAWSHGLGLGGVRKRVKQLGGEVQWREATPNGVSCEVHIEGLAERS